ncbi:Shedu anti-phage system protein SduA domain-containing protein [Conyzicola sp.]|uniref:Shedu anti-phage system protein SduA domain-containing protein n=1 Tax=Conyzicola sp. TaxID=1969404 RepID=UPI00398913C5
MPPEPSPPSRWTEIADKLDAMSAAPTSEQIQVSNRLGITLRGDLPAPVAAVVIRDRLSSAIFQGTGRAADIPEALTELEEELGIEASAQLVTNTRDEVSAWFAARYMQMTARGLRALMPEPGDVVAGHIGAVERRVISSISDDGHINFKGRPAARSWPNHLVSIARVGTADHATAVQQVDATLRNSANYARASFGNFSPLDSHALENDVPASESIRALEELLESGERLEQPFQNLLTRNPALLASLVIGSWKTYVIPQPRLGAEHVPDFLVLGFNSLGPHWVTVEIEAARHPILTQRGRLSGATTHAIQQVQDWREWLTQNVAYAQTEHHLHGLTNRAPGLVIIGRDTPSSSREPARSQSQEGAGIAVRSWDWLLRIAQARARDPLSASEFAVGNLADPFNPGAHDAPTDRSAIGGAADDELEELDIDDLFGS